MKTAYIVQGFRTAVGKAPKGVFRFKRPDELAAETIEHLMAQFPDFDKKRIDDVMVGNAMPEAEQGLNVGRLISLMGLKVTDVPEHISADVAVIAIEATHALAQIPSWNPMY